MSDVVRFGLVGYGLFGKHHARAIEKAAGGELVGICAPSEESRAAAKGDFGGVGVYGDYREMLEKEKLDVVNVVAPNWLHEEIGCAALEAGCHVLMEKPMALSLAGCDRMIGLAEEKGLVLAVNFELRMSSLWGSVKGLIDEGVIGEPEYVLIELSRFAYRQGSGGWRYDAGRVGSWILEEPIHFFDLARWYMEGGGNPVGVTGRASGGEGEGLCDHFSAVVDFEKGGYGVISQTLGAFGHHVSAKVGGSEGMIAGSWSAADARSDESVYRLTYGKNEKVVEVDLGEKRVGELVELDEHVAWMVGCVRGEREVVCDGEDGKWAVRLCLAAEESVRGVGERVGFEK